MSIPQKIQQIIANGARQIGELSIQTDASIDTYTLCHIQDRRTCTKPNFGGLETYHGPNEARNISTYATDGSYRFAKAQTNLKRGWVIILKNERELRQALDLFYPAALGLFIAQKEDRIDVENLRDKLNRQTGMYRYARNISDAGAQKLAQEVCGPAHQCAKRILWQIDENTPLEDSEASRYNGIPGDTAEEKAIPLLCREACNHFVAECRRTSKAESQPTP